MRHSLKVRFIIPAVIPLFLFFSGCGTSTPTVLNNPVRIVDAEGMVRNYTLYLPGKGNGEELPLLVYFHGVRSGEFKNIAVLKGYTGSPVSETGLIAFCRVNHIALLEILPSYSYKFMNVEAAGWSPIDREISGIETCIDAVAGNYNISQDNIYLAGISAGAVISHHLANRRPGRYRAVLSHSQAYINEKNEILTPTPGRGKFGVVFCYTAGDYENLKQLCESSYKVYKENGFEAVILRNLPPLSHMWSNSTNGRFWRLLQKTGSPLPH